MSGSNVPKHVLNKTLIFILKLLNDNNIQNWFLAYGTLLGLVRDNSCIDGDDDVDIIIDKSNYDIIKNLLTQHNICIEYGYGIGENTNILKTQPTDERCTVDFYMANLDGEGNFQDTWENVLWSKCYNEKNELIRCIWNEHILYLPANYEEKLINRYGEDWKIPKDTKGPTPHKLIL
jgi:hypothetical protein